MNPSTLTKHRLAELVRFGEDAAMAATAGLVPASTRDDWRDINIILRDASLRAASTPGASWRAGGEADPHGDRYACERAALAGGDMTDDQVANAVYLHPAEPNLTIAKDRIRWLSRALAGAAAATPDSAEPGHGLKAEQVAALLSASLKPEEIGGDAIKQHERVGELLHWFARLTRGMANPKWTTSHACELAYYIATNATNRHVSVGPARMAAFIEGCNITPAERGMLERLGTINPTAAAEQVTTEAQP